MPSTVLFVNSASASNISADGSTFDYNFQPPLQLPRDSSPTVSVLEATNYYNSPNIKLGVNDTFVVSFSNLFGGADQTFQFSFGLYGLIQFNLRLGLFLQAIGLATDTIQAQGLQAESKLAITVKPNATSGNITVKFSDPAFSMDSFLGFDTNSDFVANQALGTQTVTALKTAKFNVLEYWMVECIGLGVSGTYGPTGKANGSAIAAIVPQVAPSQQNLYRPYHPLQIPCSITAPISKIVFRLVDQNGDVVDTIGETWSARIQISY